MAARNLKKFSLEVAIQGGRRKGAQREVRGGQESRWGEGTLHASRGLLQKNRIREKKGSLPRKGMQVAPAH